MRSNYSIAALAGALMAGGLALVGPPVAGALDVGSRIENQRPARATVNLPPMISRRDSEVEEETMRALAQAFFIGDRKTWLHHRSPGYRAHKRWRRGRSSGIRGASRS